MPIISKDGAEVKQKLCCRLSATAKARADWGALKEIAVAERRAFRGPTVTAHRGLRRLQIHIEGEGDAVEGEAFLRHSNSSPTTFPTTPAYAIVDAIVKPTRA